MKKTSIQGLSIVFLFVSMLFLCNQINWMQLFSIKATTAKTEEKLGELFWGIYQKAEKQNDKKFANQVLDSLVNQLCKNNKIKRATIKLHIITKNEVNAFALPNGHLVVYTGLIANCKNQEELSGVIAHEIAHIESNHVMSKLTKEIGLTMLISMTTGNTGAESIKNAIKLLSSSAFDRKLEKEADIKAVDYLCNAKINPEAFANFLYRLAEEENSTSKYLSWISTHPESKNRAEYIIAYSKNKKIKYKSILTKSTWLALKNNLAN